MTDTPQRPAFVGGFRSGSTLLINLLGLHPEVAPWFETKFLCEPPRLQRVLADPAAAAVESQVVGEGGLAPERIVERMRRDLEQTAGRVEGRLGSGKAHYEKYPIGMDCVRYSLEQGRERLARWEQRVLAEPRLEVVREANGELIGELGRIHAEAYGAPVWINKTPEIPRFAAELRESLGPLRALLLIRDGRDVVRSASNLGWADIERLAVWWKGLIEQSRAAAAADPDGYLEVRYEDLIREPAAELDRILRFFQLEPMGEELVERYKARMGEREPFRLQRFRRIRHLLNGRRLRPFYRIAGELLDELGYR